MQQWKLIHDVERAMASRHELTDKKPRKESCEVKVKPFLYTYRIHLTPILDEYDGFLLQKQVLKRFLACIHMLTYHMLD